MNKKLRIAIIIAAAAVAILIIRAFNNHEASKPRVISTNGFAQGTTWHITYMSKDNEDLKPVFDSILKAFDFSISAYNKESLLTKINNNEDVMLDSIITEVFNNSKKIYEISDGMFDPTCRPLVNAWGFAKHEVLKKPEQKEIDSILEFVGMDKVRIVDGKIKKDDPRLTLNFNANAQGYSVDLVCDWLNANGYKHFLVEIGGETRAFGFRDATATPWRVAVEVPNNQPANGQYEYMTVVPLTGGTSLCTSGDYRNYFVDGNITYSHELNPKTGYPHEDSLLSVSIVCPTAIDGDALATAVMVLGLDKGFKLIDSLPDTEAYFIYLSHGWLKTTQTKGFVTD